jgi:hypothetical protein
MFTFEVNVKTKWYQLRRQTARALVWLARKIDKENPYAYVYFLEQAVKAEMDAMTYGQSAVTLSHVPISEMMKE